MIPIGRLFPLENIIDIILDAIIIIGCLCFGYSNLSVIFNSGYTEQFCYGFVYLFFAIITLQKLINRLYLS
jgi:hypothetical protein